MHSPLGIDLDSLIDHLPGMAFRCLNDKELTIQYASKGSVEILGYEPHELIETKAFRKMVHKDDLARNSKVLNRLSIQSPKYRLIYRVKTADGRNKWVCEEGVALFSKSGEMKYVEGLITDITDHKIIELELQQENIRLKSSLGQRYQLEQLIGKSEQMQNLYDLILKLAEKGSSVVITGESGTGKELAAHAIHSLSKRSQKSFIPVNCGAIPENLLEREFFGHCKGSFSGATADTPGYFQLANEGTLFLDEVGEISLDFQIKLLRGLDGIGYTPIGGKKLLKSDFRLICATNRDLKQLVRQGKMREDFYYRINVVPVKMPPLRKRIGDIPLLIDHFLQESRDKTTSIKDMPTTLRLRMETYSWPGNVRQLKNVIDRYLTLGSLQLEEVMPIKNFNADSVPETQQNLELAQNVENFESKLIRSALEQCHWRKGDTASLLGITMRTLQRKIKKYKIH
ncbi:sigma-54 interaction domain-containing protein [Dethiosulfatarculus sandiegensis]|uniref:RNA polymerase subunit sigma-54 n=1 Tax=Dethiosulfatarculus sandiegensis TaxID=1429043 RepID=A0A0D2HR49_9BACT|nr:sigma-54-dependent Fis family transcriptional regulator [Dethiosulfatarculus sandiegensis]KIX12968.1 RNA polymerase subunit sigma-54 [Dethiosulfatarculus sandiegensis]